MNTETAGGPLLIKRLAVVATIVHLAVSLPALSGEPGLLGIAVVGNLVLFLVGSLIYVWAFFTAANRSRTEDVWFGGAFFLAGENTVDPTTRRLLRFLVVVQSVVGVAIASARPFSGAAFAVLGSLMSWSLVALYGARYGCFRHKAKEG